MLLPRTPLRSPPPCGEGFGGGGDHTTGFCRVPPTVAEASLRRSLLIERPPKAAYALPRKGGGNGSSVRPSPSHQSQYDFGKPSAFSAMKLRINSRLTGAMRGISDSRR